MSLFDHRDLEGASRIMLKDLLTGVEYVEIAGEGFQCGCGEEPIRLWTDGPCILVQDTSNGRTIKINHQAFVKKIAEQMGARGYGMGLLLRLVAHHYLYHATAPTHNGSNN